jgi:hypothetical protein
MFRRADDLDADLARELRVDLDRYGPVRLWSAVVRGWLNDDGWAETDTYRFAGTMAGALALEPTKEGMVRIAQREVCSFVLDRFRNGQNLLP